LIEFSVLYGNEFSSIQQILVHFGRSNALENLEIIIYQLCGLYANWNCISLSMSYGLNPTIDVEVQQDTRWLLL